MFTAKIPRSMLVAASTLVFCTVASAQVKASTIAMEGTYPPYNYMTPDGKLAGFEVELAGELCKRAALKCEMVQQNWDGLIPGLQAGKYDAIMSSMTITPKRLAVIDFSAPYVAVPGGLMVGKSSPLAKLPYDGSVLNFDADSAAARKAVDEIKPMLKGKVIGVQTSTTHSTFLDKYLKDTVEIREYKTSEQANLDLLAGRVDGVWAASTIIQEALKKPEYKNLTMAGPKFSGDVFGKVGIGMRKGDTPLNDALSKAIASMRKDGSLSALTMKWFGTDITVK
jgi:octopine/nopaline transport system substrate-binding protein